MFLTFLFSCEKQAKVIGSLQYNSNEDMLTLTLNNQSNNNYFITYKIIEGCTKNTDSNNCYNNDCLNFNLVKVDGYQNKEIQSSLYLSLNEIYKKNGFDGFSKRDTLLAREQSDGFESFLNQLFILLPKHSEISHKYLVSNFKKGCPYIVTFKSIDYSGNGKIVAKRKRVQDEFYKNIVGDFMPYTTEIFIKPLIVQK
jgi:hypothetical protein